MSVKDLLLEKMRRLQAETDARMLRVEQPDWTEPIVPLTEAEKTCAVCGAHPPVEGWSFVVSADKITAYCCQDHAREGESWLR